MSLGSILVGLSLLDRLDVAKCRFESPSAVDVFEEGFERLSAVEEFGYHKNRSAKFKPHYIPEMAIAWAGHEEVMDSFLFNAAGGAEGRWNLS